MRENGSHKSGEVALEFDAWFQCINGCSGRYELNEVIYNCPHCGDLLEVTHDLERLKKRSAEEWKNLFDERYRRHDWPYGSSVWGKKELVCPNVDNDNIVSTYEGGSNLFWAERLGQQLGLEELWVKQCGMAHSGSFKDLGMTVLVSMVKQMRTEGQDIKAVACASTGDTSASLAAYCAVAGIPAIVFLPRNKISMTQLIQPITHGVMTFSLDTDFDGCMKIVKSICQEKEIYLANSMNSLRLEGQKTISFELTQQFDQEVPDFIIVPGGNLGNVSAIGKGYEMMYELGIINKLPRLVCAQAERANPLVRSFKRGFKSFKSIQARKTLASAIQIGAPVSVKKAIRALQKFDGIVEEATENELANAAGRANKTGLLCCPHTGVALAVMEKLLKRGVIKKNHRVVVISTANGLKFTDFLVKYHSNTLRGVEPECLFKPYELPADESRIRQTINEALDGNLTV
ncbi:Threonine synthase 1, chloroplastic [Nitrospina gracilis 3/211]|uniref:Threonine synthase n=1 Tax=Nitrospina gracilis (strain 3/211) TaxID=1266370 RepID=M1ZDA5_NITG3|nr:MULTISPECIES: threonine synthase [Nitrospina]MCF8724271.1 threonine synthase [Nitrospina sp. Nb-3]CCQ91419.1 Threonine synthase 1, chloroplastic [Nitrospina gracilis 3/211]